MGILLKKSDENLKSAKLLIDNKHYNASVHCSYYSSLQIMIHLLLNKYGFTKDTFDAQSKEEKRNSHLFAKNYIFDKIKEKSRFKAVDFNRITGELKTKRVKADYHEEVITDDYCENALNQAKEINSILNSVFEIAR